MLRFVFKMFKMNVTSALEGRCSSTSSSCVSSNTWRIVALPTIEFCFEPSYYPSPHLYLKTTPYSMYLTCVLLAEGIKINDVSSSVVLSVFGSCSFMPFLGQCLDVSPILSVEFSQSLWLYVAVKRT